MFVFPKNNVNRVFRNIFPVFFGALGALLFFSFAFAEGFAGEKYVFGPRDSSIEGAVGYAVLGVYRAHFKDFSGEIYFDKQTGRLTSAGLKINTGSIKSKFPFYDGVVRSPRILDVKKYPDIIFQSLRIERRDKNYFANGILTVHGVSKPVSYPFTATEIKKDQAGKEYLEAGGTWVIRRKDFGVAWDKLLDHGGFIVGEHITVDWKVKAFFAD